MDKDFWREKEFSFFAHRDCEYYPCHRVPVGEAFNCLFCYCPLYALGRDCGGNFVFLKNGRKDCSNCLLPHRREAYGYISERYEEIATMITEREKSNL
ncbi:MAG: cysteine-rich small domain-containing protein [Oscillospiraceae bacterium]